MTNNIVFDVILLEADRIISHRQKDLDLYYKDKNGGFVKLAEAYDAEVEEMQNRIFQRKKLRYFTVFQEGIDIQEELMPSSNRLLRFFSKVMTYGNKVSGYGMRDIHNCTGLHLRYVNLAIKELVSKDVIRVESTKNRRVYMVNPIYMYKGTMKKLFYCVKAYEKMPSVALDGSEQYTFEE